MLKRLSVTLLILCALVSTLAIPALADFEVVSRAVTGDTTLTPGASAQAVATGFAEGEIIDITVNGATVARGAADSSGVYTGTFVAPINLPYTNSGYVVGAKNQSGSTATGYTAVVTSTLKTKTGSGAAGSPLVINGFGFAASSLYTVTWTTTSTGTSGLTLGTGTTSKYGTLLIETTVPISSPGTYYVRGTSANIGGYYATAP